MKRSTLQKSVVYHELIQSHTFNNDSNNDDDCTLLNLHQIREPLQLYSPAIHQRERSLEHPDGCVWRPLACDRRSTVPFDVGRTLGWTWAEMRGKYTSNSIPSRFCNTRHWLPMFLENHQNLLKPLLWTIPASLPLDWKFSTGNRSRFEREWSC